MYVVEFPFNKIVRLYSTAYYRIKKSTTDTFLELKALEFLLANCKSLNYSLQPYLACF